MKNKQFKDLYRKYLSGSCSEEEIRLLFDLIKDKKYMRALEELVNETLDLQLSDAEFYHGKKIAGNAAPSIFAITKPDGKVRLFFRTYFRYAAIIVLFLFTLIWYVNNSNFWKSLDKDGRTIVKQDSTFLQSELPTLELSNGEIVYLNHEGQRIAEYQIELDSSKMTTLHYEPDHLQDYEQQFHTVRTPKGQRLKLELSDGTMVHLSVNSSLRYPSRFIGRNRSVELEGEAFFEVAKEEKPFTVSSNHQEITVLGTVFNVNAYSNKKDITTTLLEGSVLVKSNGIKTLLKPGEQSVLNINSGIITKKNVNVEKVISWQKDYIVFDGLSLEDILDLLSQWYPVKFEFENSTKQNILIQGGVQYDKDIWKILDILERTGEISFKRRNGGIIKVFTNQIT